MSFTPKGGEDFETNQVFCMCLWRFMSQSNGEFVAKYMFWNKKNSRFFLFRYLELWRNKLHLPNMGCWPFPCLQKNGKTKRPTRSVSKLTSNCLACSRTRGTIEFTCLVYIQRRLIVTLRYNLYYDWFYKNLSKGKCKLSIWPLVYFCTTKCHFQVQHKFVFYQYKW